MTQIGIVGVGDLGLAICKRVVTADFDVTVYDIDSAAMDRASRAGGKPVNSLAMLSASSDVILLTVVSDEQVSAVCHELLLAARPGTCVVVHSTIRPSTVIRIGQEAESREIGLLDIGIGGDREQAALGTLTLMIGGSESLFEAHRSFFSTYGDKFFVMGPLGAGVAAKLVNNLLVLVGYATQLEAMQLADAYGITEDRITTLLSVCEGDSRGIHIWGRHDRARRDRLELGINWYERMGRDLKEARAAGQTHNLQLPLTECALELLPSKLRDRDQLIDARGGYKVQPICRVCNVELATPYQHAGVHPECDHQYGEDR